MQILKIIYSAGLLNGNVHVRRLARCGVRLSMKSYKFGAEHPNKAPMTLPFSAFGTLKRREIRVLVS